MKNSESIRPRATEILNIVAGLLDERRIAQQIDAPINKALDEFNCPEDDDYSQERFTETTARFVAHVYESALPGGRKPTVSQARDEAAILLSQAYEGTHAGGYPGAILDAADASGPGIKLILARMTESIKKRAAASYVHPLGKSQLHRLRRLVHQVLDGRNSHRTFSRLPTTRATPVPPRAVG